MTTAIHGRAAARLAGACLLLLAMVVSLIGPATPARADNVAQALAFAQNWSDIGLITANDTWSGVPGIEGYRGDSLASTNIDPQIVLAADDPGVLDVNANQTNPNSFTTGGVSEFEIPDAVVALQGSGTADAPYIRLSLSTAGYENIRVQYNLRDIDSSTDNAVQQVALHYRVSLSGTWTNVPAAYVADATTGPSLAALVTPIDVFLPANASDQPVLQLRVMTTDSSGSDEWVGVDDISVTGTPLAVAGPVINEFSISTVGTDVEYIEVLGEPNTSFANLTVLDIEGEGGGAGAIDSVITVGTTDANGFYLASLPANEIENDTVTLLLVNGFNGNLNQDLDTNNDGTLDITPWTSILDSVAIRSTAPTVFTYAEPVLTSGFDGVSFSVGGASRIPDGQDTDITDDWVRNDFDLVGIPSYSGSPIFGEALNTPGATNQAVPEGDITPSVTSQPQNQSIAAGQTATLSVVATGTAPLNYQWYAGTAPDISTPVGSDSPIYTTPAMAEGSYGYWVRVSNAIGSADSATATVTVQPAAALCSAADTPIGLIQGVDDAADRTGTQTVQGVVVGDYEGTSPNLRGFYLQNTPEKGDDNPTTSDGIFVFVGDNSTTRQPGQVVQVTGTAGEFQGQTQISAATIEDCGSTGTVTPVDVTMPFLSADYLERYESMLVRFSQTLYVTEFFQLGRFGQVVMSPDRRLPQPTNIVQPGADALAVQAANNLNRIIVDDELNNQNPDPIKFGRGGNPLSASNTLRGGDTAAGIVGVMTYTWSGNSASGNAYRLRPVGALGGGVPNFVAANPRPAAAPSVGGSVKVSAYNVLNYFLTIGNTCGPTQNLECRGASSADELTRQRTKLLQALKALDADVLGLIELENTTGVDPVGDLVSGLNALTAPGTFAAIDTGTIGTDAIKVGLIYKPGVVTPVGPHAILDSSVDPRFIDTKNRPALAQSFRENATGAIFTAAVNHLKSKGSDCNDVGDSDTGDGQGNCNLTREAAAEALVDWLAATFDDPDFLILGDLNSYAKEDPVAAILAGPDDTEGTADDYTNLILQYGGPDTYSYVFDGQWGYLDHALASPSLAAQVTGAAEYHINADEPSVLDYNTEFKSAGQIVSLYAADEFRTSDHDPVLVGLNLTPLYRAVQGVGTQKQRVAIERNIGQARLGDFDNNLAGDGWAMVGRTNGAADNGELRGFFVGADGTPYAVVFNYSHNKGNRCILVTPRSLDVVTKGQTRIMNTVEDPYINPQYGCQAP